MGDNDLGMAFSSKSSTFKKRFFIPYTLIIDKLSGLDIINSINNKILVFPEAVIKIFFVFRANFKFDWLELTIMVYFIPNMTGHLAFIFSHMVLSKKELPI